MRLRKFEDGDAKTIIGWIKDEVALRKWSADRLGAFPATARDLIEYYDGLDRDTHFPMTLTEDGKIVGHLLLRYTDEAKTVVRFGFVIVDDALRGRGYGKKMLLAAMDYAFGNLKAKEITIGVFENNTQAYRCYLSVGFQEQPTAEYYDILGEKWKCIELRLPKKFL